MAKAKNTKAKLVKALEQKGVDLDKVLNLAHALADEDDQRIRFSIDASLIDRLGRELVAKQETAVAELVKNAYDADATTVKLTFRDSTTPLGTLEIRDNGHGMTREEVIAGFMRISTRDKLDNPTSRKYGRERAGRKGIGRFAAQRIGLKLTLLTQVRRAKHALKVTIDWQAYKGHRDLYTITNEIETIENFRKGSGTTLLIENMRDGWADGQIQRTYRYIAELLQPFPLSKKRRSPRGERPNDPGFKATFISESDGVSETIANIHSTFYENASAIIEAYVDEKGRGYWSVISQRYNLGLKNQHVGPDENAPKKAFASLRNVHLRAYYFLEDRDDELPWNLKKIIRQALQDHGGIRLYRNGFRVLPYGEIDDDWLRLDLSYRRRIILPQHGNQNFFGFIEVRDSEGEVFEETSSREGLIENEAYQQLTDFGFKTITAAVIKIAGARGRKQTSSIQWEPPTFSEKAESLAERLESLGKGSKDKRARERFRKLADQIRDLGQEGAQQLQDQIEENAMLRVLSGMGLSIGEFTHEIRFLIGALEIDLGSMPKGTGKAAKYFKRFKANLGTLTTYANYFDRAVADNVHREMVPLELRDVAIRLEDAVEPWLGRKGIKLKSKFKGYGLFTRPMHPSEWASILLNLCTNAVKAIERSQVDGKILIQGGEIGDFLFLEFADNGDGIPKANRDKVFDAFYTTTLPPGASSDVSTELAGTGLGLKIVKDILINYNGDITLTEPPKGYSTCFRIEVPRAKEEEIPDDAY